MILIRGFFTSFGMLALVAVSGCSVVNNYLGNNASVNTDTVSISTKGHTAHAAMKKEDSVRLVAAQTTLKNGGTHFYFVPPKEVPKEAAVRAPITPSEISQLPSVVGDPATKKTLVSGDDVQIKILKIAEGKTPPQNAFDAQEVIRLLEPTKKKK